MLRPGQTFEAWIVEESLGTGGMGSVWKCRHRHSSRITAAIKALDPTLRQWPQAEARFVREAEILFRLDHPNVVKVRSLRLDTEPAFLEMEHVEGRSLTERLREGPLHPDEALSLADQLFDALTYLHERGVCHRDIKPDNLLVDRDGWLKLVDFGVAMDFGGERLTTAGLVFGTIAYAPPEWIRPTELDPVQWDLYACGVVLYEMLAGSNPFTMALGEEDVRSDIVRVMGVKQRHPPLDPGPAFPDELRSVIRDLTHCDWRARPQSARDVHTRLRALVTGDVLEQFRRTPRSPGNETPVAPIREDSVSPTWFLDEAPSIGGARPPTTTLGRRAKARRRLVWLGTTAVAALVAEVALIVALGASFGSSAEADVPGRRSVSLAVSSEAAFVTLDGSAPSARIGSVSRWDDVPAGRHRVAWACADHACTSGSLTVDVAPHAWPAVGTLALETPHAGGPSASEAVRAAHDNAAHRPRWPFSRRSQ